MMNLNGFYSAVRAAFSSPQQWFVDWARGWDSERKSRALTSEDALSYAPIWYGVNKISGHIAQLPVCVYRKLDRGSEKDTAHTIYKLFRRPNPYQTSIVFREQLANHMLLEGNARAAIVKSGSRAVELIPLMPGETASGLMAGEKYHVTRPAVDSRLRLFFPSIKPDDPRGQILLRDNEVLHIPGLSYDGITGLALRDIARRNLNASINAEERLSQQMNQGFSGNLMLNAPPGVFTDQQDAEEFLEAFEKRHHSPEKAGKPGLLREGITADILSLSNQDAEMIENRKFQRQDAALYLGLETILGDDASVSYNSLVEKNMAYLTNTLSKILERFEQEIEAKLLPVRQFATGSHYVRFDTSELLKADYQTTIESAATAIAATIISPNEAREKINLNPYEGGDIYANPAINVVDNGSSDPPEEPQEEQEETAAQPDTQAKLAVRSRLAHLFGVEASKVAKAAKKAQDGGKNFVEWVDGFYSREWLNKLADSVEEMGMDRQLAEAHCEESKRRILEACSCPPERLGVEIESTVAGWKSRALNFGESSDV